MRLPSPPSVDYIRSRVLQEIDCKLRGVYNVLQAAVDSQEAEFRRPFLESVMSGYGPSVADLERSSQRRFWIPASLVLDAFPHLRMRAGTALFCVAEGSRAERCSAIIAVGPPFLDCPKLPTVLEDEVALFPKIQLPAGLDWNLEAYLEDDDEPVGFLERSLFGRWAVGGISSGHAGNFGRILTDEEGDDGPVDLTNTMRSVYQLLEESAQATPAPWQRPFVEVPAHWNPLVYHRMNTRLVHAPRPQCAEMAALLNPDNFTLVRFYIYNGYGDRAITRFQDWYSDGECVYSDAEDVARIENSGFRV